MTPMQSELPPQPSKVDPAQNDAVLSTGVKGPEGPDFAAQKLKLEVRKLRFDTSILARFLQYLSTIGQIIALFGLIITIRTGFRQQDAIRKEAIDARFERAYAKLGANSPAERATGVAQLASLLLTSGTDRDREILAALVNQDSLEDRAEIRSSIQNIFDNLRPEVDKRVLNATLDSVVRTQNALIKNSSLTKLELAATFPDRHNRFMIPSVTGPKLVEPSQQQSLERLTSMKPVLLSLIKSGAQPQNLTGVFCSFCDFSKTSRDLSGVNFSGAILPFTTWNGMELNHADFSNAYLGGAYFLGSHLQSAKLSNDLSFTTSMLQINYWRASQMSDSVQDFFNWVKGAEQMTLPFIPCADLTDANLTDFPLVVVAGTISAASDHGVISGSDITRADLRKATVILVTRTKKADTRDTIFDGRTHTTYSILDFSIESIDGTVQGFPNLLKGNSPAATAIRQELGLALHNAKNNNKARLPVNLDVSNLEKPINVLDCARILQENRRADETWLIRATDFQ